MSSRAVDLVVRRLAAQATPAHQCCRQRPDLLTVTVLAFDEASARKKVERALAASRKVATDVEATGVVWTYATTPKPAGET